MQALIINARLSFSIGQGCLALDHTLGESASQNNQSISQFTFLVFRTHHSGAAGGIANAHALSRHGDGEGKSVTVKAKP